MRASHHNGISKRYQSDSGKAVTSDFHQPQWQVCFRFRSGTYFLTVVFEDIRSLPHYFDEVYFFKRLGLAATLENSSKSRSSCRIRTCRIVTRFEVIMAGTVQNRGASFVQPCHKSLYLAQGFLEIVSGDKSKFLEFGIYQLKPCRIYLK